MTAVTTTVRATGRRVRLEQLCFWRHRQMAFFTFLLPVALLVLLGEMNGHNRYEGVRVIDWEVPGLLAFGLISATYTNLAINVTSLRETGILKRLRATPLSARTFVLGQIGSSLLVAGYLTTIFVIAARALFGVSVPLSHVPAFLITLLVGAACFCALGLAVTIPIRSAEAASPIVQATYIPLALVSGVFFTPNTGGPVLRAVTGALPLRPLAAALDACFAHGAPGAGWRPADLAVMAAWGAAGAIMARRAFRWTPSH